MRDCQDERIRDLLPDYAFGRLTDTERAAVEAHLGTCVSCAAELAVVRAAHSAFGTPRVDVAKIVAALPKPVIPLAPRIQKRRVRFTSWRIAAMIATIAVAGVSITAIQGLMRDSNKPPRVVIKKPVETTNESGLSVGGNLNDLNEQEMQTLLDKLDELDAVPSAEPQPAVSGMRAAAGVQ